jgi:hypothetical protein
MPSSLYNRHLRAIGQALEAQAISTFELKVQAGRYIVNGVPDKPETLMAALIRWRRGPRIHVFDAQTIATLEKKGQARRTTNTRLPDFYNVSNVLRTIGAYLDTRKVRLLQIQKQALTLILTYQSPDGHPHIEDRTIASFHDAFIEMHGQRSRSKVSGAAPGRSAQAQR